MMPFRMNLLRAAATLATVAGLASFASAAPAKKYHFELTAVTPKPEVKGDAAKEWNAERYYNDSAYAVSPKLVPAAAPRQAVRHIAPPRSPASTRTRIVPAVPPPAAT